MPILNFPNLRQTFEYDCGPTALQAVLAYYGIKIREELLIKYAKTSKKDGTRRRGMINVLKKAGLKHIAQKMTVVDLRKFIDKKVPVLVLLQAWSLKKKDYSNSFSDGHWVVAIGYEKDRIIFEDPNSFSRTFLKDNELEARWHTKFVGETIFNFGLAVFGRAGKYDSNDIIHMD
jgi:ABC-type bacteriocin/lantibiotic exporter with double-glycine peptidase domain